MSSWKLIYRHSAHTGKLVPVFNYHLLFFLASAGLIQCSVHCQHPQSCNSVWLIRMQILHPFPVLLGFFQLTGLNISSLFLGAQGICEAVFRPRHWYILLGHSTAQDHVENLQSTLQKLVVFYILGDSQIYAGFLSEL